jgi:hypothetical protein
MKLRSPIRPKIGGAGRIVAAEAEKGFALASSNKQPCLNYLWFFLVFANDAFGLHSVPGS